MSCSKVGALFGKRQAVSRRVQVLAWSSSELPTLRPVPVGMTTLALSGGAKRRPLLRRVGRLREEPLHVRHGLVQGPIPSCAIIAAVSK